MNDIIGAYGSIAGAIALKAAAGVVVACASSMTCLVIAMIAFPATGSRGRPTRSR